MPRQKTACEAFSESGVTETRLTSSFHNIFLAVVAKGLTYCTGRLLNVDPDVLTVQMFSAFGRHCVWRKLRNQLVPDFKRYVCVSSLSLPYSTDVGSKTP